jgi:hypothetical protein
MNIVLMTYNISHRAAGTGGLCSLGLVLRL